MSSNIVRGRRGSDRTFKWPVVPICEKQRRDVRPEDLIEDGLYRVCDTYKGGGGYDQFPAIYRHRHKSLDPNVSLEKQFVVQLHGCPLSCPWCYVTEDGVHGKPIARDTKQLIEAFKKTGLHVFHLMGGAPALYIDQWPMLLAHLPKDAVFHSDMLLIEHEYDNDTLERLGKFENALYAVSFKGFRPETYKQNTGREIDLGLMSRNLWKLRKYHVPTYATFTNMADDEVEECKAYFKDMFNFADSFSIELKPYLALEE